MKHDVHQAIRQTPNTEYLSCKCDKSRWLTENKLRKWNNKITTLTQIQFLRKAFQTQFSNFFSSEFTKNEC